MVPLILGNLHSASETCWKFGELQLELAEGPPASGDKPRTASCQLLEDAFYTGQNAGRNEQLLVLSVDSGATRMRLWGVQVSHSLNS